MMVLDYFMNPLCGYAPWTYSKIVSDTNNVNFKSFEKIIPNNLCGTKPGTSVDRKVEVDFMHFQGPAHKILSTNIYNFLKTNDF